MVASSFWSWRTRMYALAGRIDAVKTAEEIVQDTMGGFYQAMDSLKQYG